MKQIIIPVAAFAVTATGVHAFNADRLAELDLDLTNSQISALEEAHEVRTEGGGREEIREILEGAGIDEELRKDIRTAVREVRQTTRAAIKEAVADADYEAFLAAAEGTKVGELVDTEDEFELLVEAHELKEVGDKEGAKEIMEELVFEKPKGGFGRGHRGGEGAQ